MGIRRLDYHIKVRQAKSHILGSKLAESLTPIKLSNSNLLAASVRNGHPAVKQQQMLAAISLVKPNPMKEVSSKIHEFEAASKKYAKVSPAVLASIACVIMGSSVRRPVAAHDKFSDDILCRNRAPGQ
ncbi:conserved hypothetical protein [Ricinus communis]|uniref:Uncharacterized protein n=1 Tax=Ricinus communis TaxID=3988 RepID=B9S2V5_RICCO|nr:conserved hypothetical protein [Ricinus communis]